MFVCPETPEAPGRQKVKQSLGRERGVLQNTVRSTETDVLNGRNWEPGQLPYQTVIQLVRKFTRKFTRTAEDRGVER